MLHNICNKITETKILQLNNTILLVRQWITMFFFYFYLPEKMSWSGYEKRNIL